MEAEKEEARLAREHAVTMKQLDMQVQKLEARWSSLFRLPLTILKLPVYLLLGIAFIAATIRKYELPKEFWQYLK